MHVIGVGGRRLVTMSRILFTTNYSMTRAWDAWLAQQEPGQHLWGTAVLKAAGYEIQILPNADAGPTNRVAAALRSRLGDARAQWAVVHAGGLAAFAYSADRDSLAGLALARNLGLWRHPLVCVVNPEASHGALRERGLKGYDLTVAISAMVQRDLLELGRDPARTLHLPWGPDLEFPGYRPLPGELVVSSGKTRRDQALLIEALQESAIPGKVHVQDARFQSASTVKVCINEPYASVLQDLCTAGVVAIPLKDTRGTVGLTELNDALALGKPVIMTRNPYIDVDIEAIGCGIWVDLDDRRSWVAALRQLADPEVRRAMGARGRVFAQEHWNAQLFGAGLVAAVSGLLSGG